MVKGSVSTNMGHNVPPIFVKAEVDLTLHSGFLTLDGFHLMCGFRGRMMLTEYFKNAESKVPRSRDSSVVGRMRPVDRPNQTPNIWLSEIP